MRLCKVGLVLLVCGAGAARSPAQTPTPRRPNVIVIVADDLGYGDLSLHGSPDLKTPSIDALARSGVRCVNGYVSCPVCAPTRAGIMTGRYQQRFGLEFNPGPGTTAGESGLPRDEITLAEALKKQGYATGMVGKWHLGGAPGLRPPERGFEHYFGFLEGAHAYVPPTDPTVIADPRPIVPYQRAIWRGLEPARETEYLTHAFTREALAFIDTPRDRPFFLYLTYNAVHSPLQGDKDNLDRVEGVGHPRRKLYASMLTALDDGVGKLMARLREKGLEQNTLVFFVSDNGGAPQPYNTTNNRPFSGKKGELLEGGIHIPYFVRWTGTLPAGATYSQPVITLDIYATAVAMAGGVLPGDRVYDGVNLVPFLSGSDRSAPHDALYWRYGEYLAIRKGPWKLHKTGNYPGQLYDLDADVGETTDLSRSQPARTQELESALARWNAQLRAPLWGAAPPHERNIDWLYEVMQDPRLRTSATSSSSAAQYWPKGSTWATLAPAAAGMDEGRLQAAVQYALEQKSLGVLVLRGGKIVAEGYAPGWGPEKARSIASATKSMTAFLVGIALDEGKFQSLDQPVADFAPAWKGTPKQAIRLRHLLSMTSGLDAQGFSVGVLKGDQFEINQKMPLKAPPGTAWEYNTVAYHMLFRLIEKATGESLEAYAQRKLFGPIGMEHHAWIKSPAGAVTNYYRLQCSTRDLARFGLFALRGGQWDGQPLVSKAYFSEATTPSQDLNPAYGYLWWLNAKETNQPMAGLGSAMASLKFPGAPRDLIAAMGAEGQNVLIVPSLDLVVVRQGESPPDGALAAKLLMRVIESMNDKDKPARTP
jgi:arylsulfatase A-like enzyme/CubicO group peptidase (beta-lactamase class C family)